MVVSQSGGEWLYAHRWLDAALGRHHRGAATEEVRDLCARDDCGWTGALEETQPIRDFWSWVEPGGIMPAGECPVAEYWLISCLAPTASRCWSRAVSWRPLSPIGPTNCGWR